MSHYEVLKAIKLGISSDHYTTLLAKIYGQGGGQKVIHSIKDMEDLTIAELEKMTIAELEG